MDIEIILKKKCFVIDILPKRVKENSPGQFFKIEEYFLKNIDKLHEKFFDIIIKINCYYDLEFLVDGNSFKNPTPVRVKSLINSKNYILIKFKNSLITINHDDIYMTLYNPDKEILKLITDLSNANGLFVREGECAL